VVLCKGSAPTGGSLYAKVWTTASVSGAGADSAQVKEALKMYNKAYEGTHTFMGTCAAATQESSVARGPSASHEYKDPSGRGSFRSHSGFFFSE
jgi:hypothetical protein